MSVPAILGIARGNLHGGLLYSSSMRPLLVSSGVRFGAVSTRGGKMVIKPRGGRVDPKSCGPTVLKVRAARLSEKKVIWVV